MIRLAITAMILTLQAQHSANASNGVQVRRAHACAWRAGRKFDIAYPYLVGGERRVVVRINRAIHECVNRRIGPFWPGTEGHTYKCDYQITNMTAERISIRFDFELPMGGASGWIDRTVGFNYSLTTGSPISLPQLRSAGRQERVLTLLRSRNPYMNALGQDKYVFERDGVTFFCDADLTPALALGGQRAHLSRRELEKIR